MKKTKTAPLDFLIKKNFCLCVEHDKLKKRTPRFITPFHIVVNMDQIAIYPFVSIHSVLPYH